jgi:uncharacterized BrkB/YihY/UPF0761 family membrane protein
MGPHEPEPDAPESLAAQLAELQARPIGDRRIDRARARSLELAERATTWGPMRPAAEIGWLTLRRDAAIGGSVLAAALAYRIFIWLLPLALVLVLGLGWAANSSTVLDESGLGGYVAQSVATAAENVSGWARLAGLFIGCFVLLYETYALLRAMRAVTAIAWRLPVRPTSRPGRDTMLFLVWVLAFTMAASGGSAIRRQLAFPVDVVAWIASYVLLSALFVALAWWLLPHAAEHLRELVPGGLLVGAAVILIGLFNWLVLFPWLSQKEETYGVLGVAAGLLFGFFLIGRTVELAASLNAVLSERRQARRLAR